MALGKAFIEVHADTKPFAQELGKELGRILKAVENGPARKAGEKIGKDLGDGATESFDKSFKPGKSRKSLGDLFQGGGSEGESLGQRLAKGLIDSIDDGLSGLPKEVKLALGGLIGNLAPFLLAAGGALGAALITGFLAVGPAALGIALASQTDLVKKAWENLGADLKPLIADIVDPISQELLKAFALIRVGLASMAPELGAFFGQAGKAIGPLLDHLMSFVQKGLPLLTKALTNVESFADILGQGIENLGLTTLSWIETIANNDDAKQALADVLTLIQVIVGGTFALVNLFLDLYGVMRDLSEFGDFFDIAPWNNQEVVIQKAIKTNLKYAESEALIAAATEASKAATDALNDAINEYVDKANAAWGANIDFEQSLDDLTASLKENGRTTDINTQKGRDNQEALRTGVIALRKQRDETIALTGDTAGANAVFETNRKRLEDAAVAGGITRQRFAELTAAILAVPPPIDAGVSPKSIDSLIRANAIAAQLAQSLRNAANNAAGISVGNQNFAAFNRYADGGIFNRPTVGMFGEAGEEVILPTTNPGRTAELISQSPMLSSMMSPNVAVYIGNQQIDAYIDERVARSQTATARSLSYGSRSI